MCPCSVVLCFGVWQTAVGLILPWAETGVWCAEKAIGPHCTKQWKKQRLEGWWLAQSLIDGSPILSLSSALPGLCAQ